MVKPAKLEFTFFIKKEKTNISSSTIVLLFRCLIKFFLEMMIINDFSAWKKFFFKVIIIKDFFSWKYKANLLDRWGRKQITLAQKVEFIIIRARQITYNYWRNWKIQLNFMRQSILFLINYMTIQTDTNSSSVSNQQAGNSLWRLKWVANILLYPKYDIKYN